MRKIVIKLFLVILLCAGIVPAMGADTVAPTPSAAIPAGQDPTARVNDIVPAPSVVPGLDVSKDESNSLKKAYNQARENGKIVSEDKEQVEAVVIRRRRDQLLAEITYIESKIDWAKKKFVGKASSNFPDEKEIDKWKREVAAWEARLANAKADLIRLAEDASKIGEAKDDTNQVTELPPAAVPTVPNANSGTGISPSPTMSAKPVPETILPSETLEIFVAEDDTLNGLYQVRRGGYIILARVGRIFVTGKTLEEAEEIIKAKLEVDQLRHATVTVEKATGKEAAMQTDAVIYLAGEFLHPGPWIIPTNMLRPTVITSILRSGGVSEYADLEHVKILRLIDGRPLVEEINVQAILDGNELTSDLTLRENDIIHVPARSGESKQVYVSGNVLRPGSIKMPPNEILTVYSAVLRSGGFARFANLKKVFVLRDLGNGVKSRIPINIEEVKQGTASDLPLESGDIVVVPEKFFSF